MIIGLRATLSCNILLRVVAKLKYVISEYEQIINKNVLYILGVKNLQLNVKEAIAPTLLQVVLVFLNLL